MNKLFFLYAIMENNTGIYHRVGRIQVKSAKQTSKMRK